jgi:hypothetical protein
LAAAAGAAAGAIAAGRSPVAMYLSVRGGTSPTAVTWCPSTIVVNAEATPDLVVPWLGFFPGEGVWMKTDTDARPSE